MHPVSIVAWAGVSLDGYTSGPEGPAGDAWLHEHATHPQTAEYFEGVWRGADTILIGRTNYEGFYSVWPGITRDERTDSRTRELGHWLDTWRTAWAWLSHDGRLVRLRISG